MSTQTASERLATRPLRVDATASGEPRPHAVVGGGPR
ncbi:hypothetical protein SAMN04490220_7109 [Rhodococcus jostii]|uniref:Uncharacterized protein n=1 Tax=Rhodococcus jostii TaxID=132919 RepID=A0A1H5H8N9_RHOJO|nr:hypothetical protein SAMN04490220_7109 [Rhodococcus jostii]